MSEGRIGTFELREKLGEGGMGQVFLASDSRLDRDVALKLLPDSFANDSVRMARFEREAKLLASLNHPNIAAIYGIEEADGRKALVMEYVPGEDLAKRVRRGPLPLDEALDIAVAIARALESAHAAGVVHRDLKPANVVLRPDGQVKLLDLGLAKSLEAGEGDLNPENSPTISFHATQLGQILGTAAYMSPEQARGRKVDARSDVFSFGCTLFELIAGAPAFSGEDVSELLASVIKGDIRWDRLPGDVPAPVRRILARCLETDVDQRYQAIGDARYDLVAYRASPAGAGDGRSAGAAAGLSRRLVAVVVVAAVAAGAAGSLWLRRDSPPASTGVVKFAIETDETSRALISPDGRRVAYGKDGEVWVRDLGVLRSRPLNLPRRAQPVTWTRNSKMLIVSDHADLQDQVRLWRVDPDGGEPQDIGRVPEAGFNWGVSPLGDDELLLGMANGGLHAMSIATGSTRLLLAGDDTTYATGPIALPGSDAILYVEASRGVVKALVDGEQRLVFELEGNRVFDPVYSLSGHLLVRSSTGKNPASVWAVPFSLERLAPTGEPFQIAKQGLVSVSDTGTLVFTRLGNEAPPRQLVWVGRDGTVLGSVAGPLPGLRDPAISPDGTRVAVAVAVAADDEFGGALDIHIIDMGTGAAYRLPDDLGGDRLPWWQDDRTVGYHTWTSGIRQVSVRAADGSTPPEKLIEKRVAFARPSADRRYLVTSYSGVHYIDLDAGETRTLIDDRKVYSADLSPDNAFIAYSILWRGSGLMVRSFPAGDNLIAVTSAEVGAPRWSRDGTEIFYWQEGALMSVSFEETADGRPRTGTPTRLFEAGPTRITAGAGFDLAADGRFLMVQETGSPEAESDEPEIVVVENWFREFAGGSSR